MTSTIAYIVCAKVAADYPALNIKRGTEVWLHEEDFYFGWIRDREKAAIIFNRPKDEVEKIARNAHGPWYYEPDPDSIKLIIGKYTPPQNAKFEPLDLTDKGSGIGDGSIHDLPDAEASQYR